MNLKKIIIICVLLILFTYICSISMLPDNMIVMQGEKIKFNTLLGISLKKEENSLQVSSNINEKSIINNEMDLSVNLFDKIKLKTVNVSVIPQTKVVPLGNLLGLKLYTKGVLVVGMSEIKGIDNKKYKPYEESGIEEGDMIIKINEENISTTTDLVECVNSSNGERIEITYLRNDETKKCELFPTKTSDNEYKIGLWVRDAAAGVGTASFYDIETGKIAALGHGITDVDTGDLVTISNGELITTNVLSISKGEEGEPGEIRGTIEGGNKIGNVEKNTSLGIFGEVSGKNYLGIKDSDAIDVANRNEIKEGKAYIICELETGKKGKYEIEIEKIYTANNHDNKSMLIKITDSTLLEKTGGIIQGMSGSPIIQNGKLIGAVTHVLVNNPTEGYAVFADMMLKQMKTVE